MVWANEPQLEIDRRAHDTGLRGRPRSPLSTSVLGFLGHQGSNLLQDPQLTRSGDTMYRPVFCSNVASACALDLGLSRACGLNNLTARL